MELSLFGDVKDRVRGYVSPAVEIVRKRVLGANNERLDFIMDSFYKLSPQHRTAALLGLFASLGLVVLGVFAIYFSRINALETELNEGLESLKELRTLVAEYNQEKNSLNTIKDSVSRKTSSFKPKVFFEGIANQTGVVIEALQTEDTDIVEGNPLAGDFQTTNVEFKLPKISIPKMLKFFGEVEKADQNLSVSNLTIRARFGDKLYFDTQAKVVGLKVKGGSDEP
ncbi:MAG: hypothetical protein AB7T49_05275 [Oligoflexales bacterium]